jgi:MGT family glycosyltransferase
MKFVILVPEAHGHVNPTLPLAAELAARGHEVIYFLPEKFAPAVAANGASVRPIAPIFNFPSDGSGPPIGLRRTAEMSAEQQAAMTEFAERLRGTMNDELPKLKERIAAEAADCVIYDVYGMWVPGLARDLPEPKVAFFPTFAIQDGRTPLDTISTAGRPAFPPALMERVAQSGLMSIGFFKEPFRAEGLNIVTLPRSFQPNPTEFDARYLFVGPSIRSEGPIGDFPLDQLAGKQVALVSLGTAAADATFFDACFEAFAGSDWLVVASTGRTDPATLRPLPSNVIARPHLPQLAVLERASVFVTHGGMNSAMEGLWYGVPLVVVPQHADQHLVAERVTARGLGLALDGDKLTGEAVREAVDAVIADQRIATNVAEMQTEMQAAGGAPRAADAVERFAIGMRAALVTEPALT